ECSGCGHFVFWVPDQEGLIGAVASWRITQPARLSPKELQLLRKAMGLKAVTFAAKMRVTPETLSRWENGKDAMSAQSERYCRIVSALQFRDKAHSVKVDIAALIEMDFVPFKSTPKAALPQFIRVVSRDKEEHRKREW